MTRIQRLYSGLLVLLLTLPVALPAVAQDATSGSLTPVASDLDPKDYRGLMLENGLKVLLVSDASTDRAAASLDVHVGSASDPAGWNGLAHFLEHMLFLGTGKYPEAGEYQSFIQDHGGSHNAYTAYDHTNYFFSVKQDSLEPALDRFSRFFIDPTFEAQYVERERSVVHSEYQARLKDEGRRIWETQKEILNPGHPASRFSVGSEETLQDRESMSVRDRLISFYEQWYSAGIMALTVVGREPLDQLETWVREKFAEVPDRGVSAPVYPQSYLNRDLAPVRLDVVPEKEVNSVSFQFQIPSLVEEYHSKPLGYIANLLGHEGEGSLLAALKDRGWAESLSAGAGFMDRHQGTLMVSIGLTEPGVDHIREIGEMLFYAIALVRDHGLETWRFEEQRQLGEIAFRFAEEPDAAALARSLSARMHDYPMIDVLRGPYIMDEFDPDRIRELLTMLVPERVYLQVVSQKAKVRRITDWYGVRYGIEPLDADTLAAWQTATENSYADLALPEPNPYIPERLDLVTLEDPDEIPVRLPDAAPLEAWYQGDQEFRAPRASYFVSVKSPLSNASARDSVLTEIVVRLLNDQLNPVSYPAQLAGLTYSLYRHSRGMSIRISGYQDRQPELLEVILDALRGPDFTADRLELVKAELTRELNNQFRERPSSQTIHEMYRLLMSPYWTETERLAVIPDITLDDVVTHAAALTAEVSLTSLAHGDLTEDQAAEMNQLVRAAFPDAREEDFVERPRIRKLGHREPYLRTMDVDHGDTAVSYLYQGDEKSVEGMAYARLLGQLIEAPFYFDLRTTHRVGYLVFASAMDMLDVPGLMMSVQSPTHDATAIDDLVTDFRATFPDLLAAMPEAEFNQSRTGLVAQILARETNLSERSNRYWTEIDLGEERFDSREQLAAAVESLTAEDIADYLDRLVRLKPRLLIVQSPGRRDGAADGALNSEGRMDTGTPESFRAEPHGFFPAL